MEESEQRIMEQAKTIQHLRDLHTHKSGEYESLQVDSDRLAGDYQVRTALSSTALIPPLVHCLLLPSGALVRPGTADCIWCIALAAATHACTRAVHRARTVRAQCIEIRGRNLALKVQCD